MCLPPPGCDIRVLDAAWRRSACLAGRPRCARPLHRPEARRPRRARAHRRRRRPGAPLDRARGRLRWAGARVGSESALRPRVLALDGRQRLLRTQPLRSHRRARGQEPATQAVAGSSRPEPARVRRGPPRPPPKPYTTPLHHAPAPRPPTHTIWRRCCRRAVAGDDPPPRQARSARDRRLRWRMGSDLLAGGRRDRALVPRRRASLGENYGSRTGALAPRRPDGRRHHRSRRLAGLRRHRGCPLSLAQASLSRPLSRPLEACGGVWRRGRLLAVCA